MTSYREAWGWKGADRLSTHFTGRFRRDPHDPAAHLLQLGSRRTLLLAALALLLATLGACGGQTTPSDSARATPRARLTYIAIGASDSFGIGTDDPVSESWPTDLAGQLGPSVHLVNLGIPGEQVSDALQNELPVALDERPDVVTIWLGVNDFVAGTSPSDFASGLRTLLAGLVAHTRARIAVGNLPDLTLLPAFAGQDPDALHAAIAEWNRDIAAVCAGAGSNVRLVDLYAAYAELAQHPEYIASDGFHPSALGALRLASVFGAALTKP